MMQSAETIFNQGKKSLETLLREKAYEEVKAMLSQEGIDIDTVTDNDVEVLVAERLKEKKKGMKDMAAGGALALLVSSLIGF